MDEDWRSSAACIGLTAWFFPATDHPVNAEAAKEVCRGCPVRRECREYAEETRELYGVWGGESALERRAKLGIRLTVAEQRRHRDSVQVSPG